LLGKSRSSSIPYCPDVTSICDYTLGAALHFLFPA
jgi:hypothetical protein